MKKLLIISWFLSLLLCWQITRTSVKPTVVIQKQYIKIKELEADKKATAKIAKNEKFLFIFKKGELLWGVGGYVLRVLTG